MFTLIMTITFSTAYNHNVYTISTVQNFQSEQSCRYAGAQEELTLRTDFKLKTDKQYTFICVQQ